MSQCQIYYSSNSSSLFPEIDSGIFRVDIDGSNPEALVRERSFGDLTYGPQTSTVYWESNNQIFSASLERFLEGNFTEDDLASALVPIDPVTSVSNLAVFESGNELFWTSSGLTQIHRGNIDTGVVETVYQGPGLASLVTNVRVDEENQKLIWSQMDAGILMSDIDGTNVQNIFSNGGAPFFGFVDIDPSAQEVYFTTPSQNELVQKISYDGTGLAVVADFDFQDGELLTGFAFDSSNQRLLVSYFFDDPLTVEAVSEYLPDTSGLFTFSRTLLDVEARNIVPLENSGDMSFLFRDSSSRRIAVGFDDPATDSRVLLRDIRSLAADFAVGSPGEVVFSTPGRFLEAGDNLLRRAPDGSIELFPTILEFSAVTISENRLFYADGSLNRISELVDRVGVTFEENSGAVSFMQVEGNFLYWAVSNLNNSSIRRKSLDGNSPAEVVISGRNRITGFDFNGNRSRIYWSETVSPADSSNVNLSGVFTSLTTFEPESIERLITFPNTNVIGPGTNISVFAGLTGPLAVDGNTLLVTVALGPSSGLNLERYSISGGPRIGEPLLTGVRDFELFSEDGSCGGPVPGSRVDFDGDERQDLVVWREATGTWFVMPTASTEPLVRQWGLPGDQPVLGDYDGDSLFDFTVWRPSSGTWFHCLSGQGWDCSQPEVMQWGLPGDYPLAADLTGDGRADRIVWRPSSGTWFVVNSDSTGIDTFQWGLPGDLPVTGDFDGDGIDDPGVFRPSNGFWFVLLSSRGRSPLPGDALVTQWGLPGDHPVVGDFDGDGRSDLSVWRPATGNWWSCYSGSEFDCGQGFGVRQFGLDVDVPFALDRNGDGITDFTVWREFLPGVDIGAWYTSENNILTGAAPEVLRTQWGLPGDISMSSDIRSVVEHLYPGSLLN